MYFEYVYTAYMHLIRTYIYTNVYIVWYHYKSSGPDQNNIHIQHKTIYL